jgi:hypothetical protein
LEQERSLFKEPWLWLIFGCYLAAGLISFNRGLLLADEGYELYFSWIIARGARVYKDFSLQVAPLSFLIQAALIKLFGFKLIFSRIYALALGAAGFFAIAFISRKAAAGKAWLVSAALYIFFSNNLFNFAHYSVDSKFLAVVSLAFTVAALSSPSPWAALLAGVFAGAAVCSYQSLILMTAAEAALLMAWKKDNHGRLKPLMLFLAGALLVALPVLAYLAKARLLEETWMAMVHSGATKSHVFRFLLQAVYPLVLVAGLATLLIKRLWSAGGWGRIASAVLTTVAVALLAALGFHNPALAPHLVSLLVPVVLFTLSGSYLVSDHATHAQWTAWIIGALLFLTGLQSGYDLPHNLASALLVMPWVGFLSGRLPKTARFKPWGLSAAGLGLAVPLFGAFIFMFLTRAELFGEAPPLWRCTNRLDLATASGIYTTKEDHEELESLVAQINALTQPGESILVFPSQLLIYPLSGHPSLSPAPYFYYELADLNKLAAAVDLAIARKSLVVFQLRNGKIFQPLAGSKAQALIDHLAASCAEKVMLKDYLVCRL